MVVIFHSGRLIRTILLTLASACKTTLYNKYAYIYIYICILHTLQQLYISYIISPSPKNSLFGIIQMQVDI